MIDKNSITALLLAGGRGSRMGHVDKGLQKFRGSTMAAHVLQRLAPQAGTLAINANQNLDTYALFGVPVCPTTSKASRARWPVWKPDCATAPHSTSSPLRAIVHSFQPI